MLYTLDHNSCAVLCWLSAGPRHYYDREQRGDWPRWTVVATTLLCEPSRCSCRVTAAASRVRALLDRAFALESGLSWYVRKTLGSIDTRR